MSAPGAMNDLFDCGARGEGFGRRAPGEGRFFSRFSAFSMRLSRQ
jgi:hypothetical protein